MTWFHGSALAGSLLVVGDSLSAAYGIAVEQGWVSLLERQLEDRGSEVRVINASISGETSSGGRARLPALLEQHEPDVVVIELGGNDGLRGFPIQRLRSNLQEMIELSQRHGAQVLLTGMQIPPNYGRRYTEQFSAVYTELADQYDIALVSFLLDSVALRAELMQADGIHPTAEAQRQILDNVWPLLQPLLESTAAQ